MCSPSPYVITVAEVSGEISAVKIHHHVPVIINIIIVVVIVIIHNNNNTEEKINWADMTTKCKQMHTASILW